jgi:hypothetical protein
MTDGAEIDPGMLDRVAGRLRRAGDALDSAGDAAPGTPDAGEVTALIGGMMAHLSEGAGNLVVGLREAGSRVAQARAAYERQDAAAAQEIRGLF